MAETSPPAPPDPIGRRGTADPLRVANCSGFYGDRVSAAREMVEGGPIDVLTGDWLAELTMFVLAKTRQRSGGFAGTFVRQMEEVLATCVDRGIRVVSNAGGLDPAACARAVGAVADRQGLSVRIATVTGDDLVGRLAELSALGESFAHLDTGEPLPPGADVRTANAYLGGAPIAEALAAGADVVITGRVTDASLVVGPGMWAFDWGPEDVDAVAGAVAAGHVIECGAQCTGGNYSFFDEIPGLQRPGFPLAELAIDGSAVITKHPGTGGAVTTGTVTAQLLYEIAGPRYLSPDAVAHFDTVQVEEAGPDRVRLSGTRGERPPNTLKVAANLSGGWRNAMTLVLTGSDVAGKAALAEAAVWAAVPGGRDAFDDVSTELVGDRSGDGLAFLRIAVRGGDRASVGRGFSSAVVETTLAGYPGTFFTTAPSDASEVARYWPTTVEADRVRPVVELDGRPLVAGAVPARQGAARRGGAPRSVPARSGVAAAGPGTGAGPTRGGRDRPGSGPAGGVEVRLGRLVGARSGDKGGNANIGVWARRPDDFDWLAGWLDEERLAQVLPEVAGCRIDRHVLANLRAVNFVVHGLLGWGVASNLRLDSQAKGLAELLRSKVIEVPPGLL